MFKFSRTFFNSVSPSLQSIDQLSREQLLVLIKNFAKNWLAHDGLWFQAVEKEMGLEKAIKIDGEAWRKFSPIEGKRIKSFLNLPDQPGLEGLQIALNFRLYSCINKQTIEFDKKNQILRFYMNECRVQHARKLKKLPDFPCKEVGIIEYTTFAQSIDERIKTKCITCPPDKTPETYDCGWEFTI